MNEFGVFTSEFLHPTFYNIFEEIRNRKWLRVGKQKEKDDDMVTRIRCQLVFSPALSILRKWHSTSLPCPWHAMPTLNEIQGLWKKTYGSPLLVPQGKVDRIPSLPSAKPPTSILVCSALRGHHTGYGLADSLKLQARQNQASVHNRFRCIASDLNGTWPWGKMIQN